MRVDKLRELFGLDDSEVRACWAPLLLLCSICPTAASRGCDVEHYMIRRAGERNMQQLLSQHQHMTPTSAVPSTPPPPQNSYPSPAPAAPSCTQPVASCAAADTGATTYTSPSIIASKYSIKHVAAAAAGAVWGLLLCPHQASLGGTVPACERLGAFGTYSRMPFLDTGQSVLVWKCTFEHDAWAMPSGSQDWTVGSALPAAAAA
jgi:hypothetical protein